jgi:hypothetical protein
MMSTPAIEKRPEVHSMLVIHQGALGDFILALPTLEILRKTFPQAESVIMGYPRILELVKARYYAEEILSIDQQGMANFFVREGGLNSILSQYFSQFNLIIVFGKDGEGTLTGNLRTNSSHQPLPTVGSGIASHRSSPQRTLSVRVFHFRDVTEALFK